MCVAEILCAPPPPIDNTVLLTSDTSHAVYECVSGFHQTDGQARKDCIITLEGLAYSTEWHGDDVVCNGKYTVSKGHKPFVLKLHAFVDKYNQEIYLLFQWLIL